MIGDEYISRQLLQPFLNQVVPYLSGIKAADLQGERSSKDEETMRFDVDGSAFANVDDVIEIGDDVRRVDIVWISLSRTVMARHSSK